jgi:hypothetical protein
MLAIKSNETEIRLTYNHMIFVIRNNPTIHIPSNEVRVGDTMITSGSTP